MRRLGTGRDHRQRCDFVDRELRDDEIPALPTLFSPLQIAFGYLIVGWPVRVTYAGMRSSGCEPRSIGGNRQEESTRAEPKPSRGVLFPRSKKMKTKRVKRDGNPTRNAERDRRTAGVPVGSDDNLANWVPRCSENLHAMPCSWLGEHMGIARHRSPLPPTPKLPLQIGHSKHSRADPSKPQNPQKRDRSKRP